MSFRNRARRPSTSAALSALLAVLVLSTLAAAAISGGSALAQRWGAPTQAEPAVRAFRSVGDLPMEPLPLPQVPADAQEAQPMATF